MTSLYMEKHLAQKLVCRFSMKIHQDTKKENSKNTNNQLFTIKYIKINAMGLKLVKITKD